MGSLGFWRRAQQSPGWTAVIEADGTRHTAGELLARVNQLTGGLRARGLRPGDGIAAVLPNGVAPLELYLAALQSGWYFTPINWHFTAPEIAYIVRDCEARALFVHERFAAAGVAAADAAGLPAAARFGYGTVPGCTDVAELRAGQPEAWLADRTAGSTMHYTSGTTGRPKGVRRELSGLDPDEAAELSSALLQFFGITTGPPNVHLVTSPNYHTAVTVFGGGALHLGHTLVCMDGWDAEQVLALVERYRVTNTHMVPTQFKRMLSLPAETRGRYDLASMRWLIHAAAPCPKGIKQAMLDWWGPRVYEYYAATEGGGTIATPEDWLARPGTVGTPWPVSEVMVADDDGEQCPPGVPGTVYLKMGLSDFAYKDDPAKTEAGLAPRLLHRGRYRLHRRRRLPVPLRPEVRHDHFRWQQHLPGRDRGRDHHASQGRRRRRLRDPRRRVGRAGQGGRAARGRRAGRARARGGDHRLADRPPGPDEVAQVGRFCR